MMEEESDAFALPLAYVALVVMYILIMELWS